MKSKGSALIGLAGLMFILVFSASAALAVPTTVNYQGYLTDDSGVPVSGTVSITFRIYDAPTDGTLKWNETQDVDVNNGVYSVQLGSGGSPLDESVFTGETRYLEVEIDGTPLSPRLSFTSNAYAVRAGTADSVPNGSVSTIMVADGAITSAKISAPLTLNGSQSQATIAGYGYGVYGTNTSTGSYGYLGRTSFGVYGNADGGYGVYGGSDGGTGVYGNSNTGTGVYGKGATFGIFGKGANFGIYGMAEIINGTGVYGYASGENGKGVHGYNGSAGSYGYLGSYNSGVYGYHTSGKGVYGESAGGSGVYGKSSSGYGVYAVGGSGYGVYGRGGNYGVYAHADIINGTGVYGYASGNNGKGVYGYNTTSGGHAGYFVGDVAANSYQYRTTQTYYEHVSPSDFVQRRYSTSDDIWSAKPYYGYISGGTSSFNIDAYAPVNLPEGATVTELRCYYWDGDITYDLIMEAGLMRIDPMVGGAYYMANANKSTSGTSSSTGYVSDTSISYATINNNSYSYNVGLDWTASGISLGTQFRGCRIAYTMDTVAP